MYSITSLNAVLQSGLWVPIRDFRPKETSAQPKMNGTMCDPLFREPAFFYLVSSGIVAPAVNLSTDRHGLCRHNLHLRFEKGLFQRAICMFFFVLYTFKQVY